MVSRKISAAAAALVCGLMTAGVVSAQSKDAPKPPPPVTAVKQPAPAPAPAGKPDADPANTGPRLPVGAYSLEQFGPISAGAVEQTFKKAEEAILAAGGGVLIVPANAPAGWKLPQPVQNEIRIPEAPAPAKTWRKGPAMTVIDLRSAGSITVPMGRGFTINRLLDLPFGQSLPHWDYQPMIHFKNTITHGSNSFREWLMEDIPGGKDQKFYVATIRGVFPGEFLNTGDYSGVERLYVKSLGYDKEKAMWYFVADTNGPHKKGAMIHNKNHVNLVRLDTYSHNENQTFDFMLWRHNYSQGDNYLVDVKMSYMGDVHSTSGDENGVLYAGFVESNTNPFYGEVESWNPQTQELRYTKGTEAKTFGSGRPLINVTPSKLVTAGKVRIVRPSSWWDAEADPAGNGVYQGKTYPTTIGPNKSHKVSLCMGGLIRLDKDAPVTKDHAGWYFAVTDPSEQVPGSNTEAGKLRWYLIDAVIPNADGTKDIKIIRHWWGARTAGSPTLYKDENYTTDSNDRPLSYVIAPGANVYDVSDAVNQRAPLIRVAPGPFNGTPADFAKGDSIIQAIGPDPFRPITMRSWLFESVPGAFPATMFDLRNLGHVQRASVFTIGGGAAKISDISRRYDKKTPWLSIFNVDASAESGFLFNADVLKGIVFRQPTVNSPIVWNYQGFKEASLSADRETGVMKVQANGLDVSAPITQVAGLSGAAKPANNLRGVNVKVTQGQTKVTVTFDKPEPDAEYAVFVETGWITGRAITEQTEKGFTVEFEKAPAKDGRLHWLLVR